jgi:hypothetical protein
MERVRKELGSLVVKSEHLSKKLKINEEKIDKIEVDTTTSQATNQKLVQDMAVRFVEEMKVGLLGTGTGAADGHSGHPAGNLASTGSMGSGGPLGQLGQLLPGLRERLLNKTEDSSGLARSVS